MPFVCLNFKMGSGFFYICWLSDKYTVKQRTSLIHSAVKYKPWLELLISKVIGIFLGLMFSSRAGPDGKE